VLVGARSFNQRFASAHKGEVLKVHLLEFSCVRNVEWLTAQCRLFGAFAGELDKPGT